MLRLPLQQLFTLCLIFHISSAAFTQVAQGAQCTVEQNSAGTWCFYPASNFRVDLVCSGRDAQFTPLIENHVNQKTSSIAYYSPALERLGGPEDYIVASNPRAQVFLCASGRALDGKYVTQCEIASMDNRIANPGGRCALEVGQKEVEDGCYEPGLSPPPGVSGTKVGGTRPAATATATSPPTAPIGGGAVKGLGANHVLTFFAVGGMALLLL